jgi:hypothetical protein
MSTFEMFNGYLIHMYMHYVLMVIMKDIIKENSYSGIQRHWFCQNELNKEFALPKTTYKWVFCGLSMQPLMDHDQNICHKPLQTECIYWLYLAVSQKHTATSVPV